MNTRGILLAMHGAPPTDFPSHELQKYFPLHFRFEHAPRSLSKTELDEYHRIEDKLLSWTRTADNDKFFTKSFELAQNIEKKTKIPTFVAFNEFCGPTIEEVLVKMVEEHGLTHIIVTTTMMMPGGEHSEKDIPEKLEHFKKEHSLIEIEYKWPFDLQNVAIFISDQIFP